METTEMVIVGLPVLHTELKEHAKNVDFPIKLASLIQDLFVVAVVTSLEWQIYKICFWFMESLHILWMYYSINIMI